MRRLYILSFLLLILSGCAGEKFDVSKIEDFFQIEKKEEKIIKRHKIAVLVPLSGAASEAGKGIADAAKLAIKETSAKGFDLAIYNTLNTPETAEKAAERAVKDKAEIILGPLFNAQAKVVGRVARKKGIKVISFSNDSAVAGDGVYILGLIPEQQIKQILKNSAERGVRRVSAVLPADRFGKEVQSAMQKYAAEYKMQVGGVSSYNADTIDFDENAAAIERSFKSYNNVQAIIIPEGGEKLDAILDALRKKGIDGSNAVILGTNMWGSTTLKSVASLEGAQFTTVSKAGLDNFETKFNKQYGYIPQQIDALGYDAVMLAVKLAGSDFSDSAINDASGFSGVNGVFRFSESSINERLFEIHQISGGKEEVLISAGRNF